ncbi:MAG: SRPBCC family protein [Planctomycetota bacterium]|nr:SRPBCC family protein [Planctomycetota bacterium]
MKIALIALTLVFFVVLVVGLFLPTHFVRSRSITIQADVNRVHAVVADLERWPDWTPSEKDQALTTALGPITSGVGATRTWTGTDRTEELKLVTADPASGLTYEMTYRRGSESTVMKGAIAYRSNGAATDVTWSIEGDMPVPILGGYVVWAGRGAVDAMFDKGLAKLKRVVEMQ